MKAIVYHNYGSPDVLKCEEIEKPKDLAVALTRFAKAGELRFE